MCSFWTTNGVGLGCARTKYIKNTLISERQLRNVEISVCTSFLNVYVAEFKKDVGGLTMRRDMPSPYKKCPHFYLYIYIYISLITV